MYISFGKRVLDILGSFLLLLILAPAFLLLSALIRFDSKGPVFFKQPRIGLDGKVFLIYKFRSMCVDAELMPEGLFTYDGDRRITRLGVIMRKFSIDELPQLINVLVGEMSLVGPRPAVLNELGPYEELPIRTLKRFSVKPGITGLAQVSGRNELSWDEKIEFDLHYIVELRDKGFTCDVTIFLKTITVVLGQRGINETR